MLPVLTVWLETSSIAAFAPAFDWAVPNFAGVKKSKIITHFSIQLCLCVTVVSTAAVYVTSQLIVALIATFSG